VRTQRLIAAISAEVQPGDVVVEVGTGTGVLAVAAVQAGARHVYAIEAGALAPVAREMMRANGVADRVTVVEGWSHAVSLPERGDVFVSETIGNAGFDENLVAIARDAAERLLKPGARMIPRRLSLRALPVEAAADWLAHQLFRPESAARWAEWYGIDFSVLPTLPVASGSRRLVLPRGAEAVKVLGPMVDLAEAEFYPTWHTTMESAPVAELTLAGEWNALQIFFEAELSPGIVLSTDPRPAAEEKPDHWATPLWLLPAQAVQPGQRWQIDFAWAPRGRHKLTVRAAAATS
jgi:precorrin-6B methylase 2